MLGPVRVLVGLIAAMVGLVLAGQALAASDGQLTRLGCLSNQTFALGDPCGTTPSDYEGLGSAQTVSAFSNADGTFLLSTASATHTLTLWQVEQPGNSSPIELDKIDCMEDWDFGVDRPGCTPAGSSQANSSKLEGVRGTAVFGDSVYAAAFNEGVVGVYDLDTGPGATRGLTWRQNAAHSTAMAGVSSVAVSPDGANVYATSAQSNALITFTRAADGGLSNSSCLNSNGTGGCGSAGASIDGVRDLVVTADGRFVYAIAQTADAIVGFSRDLGTGALTPLGGTTDCVSQTGSGGGCVDGHGLDHPFALAISPDGSQLYVASAISNAVAVITRNATTGALGQSSGTDGCVSTAGADGCTSAVGLSSARDVSVSPDGRHVYVAAGEIGLAIAESDAVTAFSRNASTGALTQLTAPDGCVVNGSSTASCVGAALLAGPSGTTVTPDGRYVVASVGTSSNLTVFRRELAPTCTAGSESTAFGTAKTITLACTDANGDAITRSVGSPVGGTLSAVNGDQVTFTPTAGFAGAGSFTLTATETGGTGLASAPVTIDVAVGLPAAPDTAISSGPSGVTNQAAATFAFSSPTATATGFECRVDGAAFAACTSPATVTVGAGAHTFEVRAVDGFAQSDASPAQRAWTVDLTAPDTSLASSVSGTTSETTAVMTFTSEPGATFQCQLDGGAFEACTSPRVLTGLAAGAHVFLVRAIDAAGNVDASPASQTWTVAGTLTPPNQTDTKAPRMALLPKSVTLNAKGIAAIRVTCPADETRCVGTLTLRKTGKTAKQRTVLGSKVFSVKGGKTVTVRIALGKAAIAALTKAGSLKVSAIAKATDAAGNTRTTTVQVTLKPKATKAS